MLYIHQSTCISPQHTFPEADISLPVPSVDNKLTVIEPAYDAVPPGILRRMGKAVRIGVGAALPLVAAGGVKGIIIGTANGGMEDCIRFLNQIIQYEEGMLTPGNFVQSTPNAIAAQVGLLTKNKGYNITHVHRGLAFENAMLDAVMICNEHPQNKYLLGAVDEISAYNYNIDELAGWHKKEQLPSADLYITTSEGTMAGEGAAMFIVSNQRAGAKAAMADVATLHTSSPEAVKEKLQQFLEKNLAKRETIDLLISGENGDSRQSAFYNACESVLTEHTPIARFKHMTGEFATASALAAWLACYILESQVLPLHMIKKNSFTPELKKILIYNNHKGSQHAFILIEKPV